MGLGRFELPTNGLGNRCSIHLSYSPALPHCNTFPARRAAALCLAVTANQFGGPPGGADRTGSGCSPGATLSIRNFLKIVGQYSFNRLLPALKASRMP